MTGRVLGESHSIPNQSVCTVNMQCNGDFLYIQFMKVAWEGEMASVRTVRMHSKAVFLYIQQGGGERDARSGPGMTV